eukprot:TRINITY_DN2066_c0_g2_i1.p1 TRINITY_DN2066_c0_g2~~TRINITY_DN2066_c0_g2_i1.p1  ORF type:complete len:345 (-),score=-20.42 TRINITY_DN2066_c0_g2_i1:374-1408(-)
MQVSHTAIVILNYNNWEDTIECLESVLKLESNHQFTIFIVDNSTTNESIQKLIMWAKGILEPINYSFPEIIEPFVSKPIKYQIFQENELINANIYEKVIFVKALNNNGFAAGNNIVLKKIQNEWVQFDLIWLLNNDTIIKSNTLSEIVRSANRSKKSCLFAGTPLLEYYEPSKIQAIGGVYNKYFGYTSHVGVGLNVNHIEKDIADYKVDYPIGASLILSRKFLKEIGLMNEIYFLFFEELDWVERYKRKGGSFEIFNILGVFHKQGGSTKIKTHKIKKKPELIDLLSLKNRILFTKTYFNYYLFSVIGFISTITVFKRLIRGDFKRGYRIYQLIYKEVFEEVN